MPPATRVTPYVNRVGTSRRKKRQGPTDAEIEAVMRDPNAAYDEVQRRLAVPETVKGRLDVLRSGLSTEAAGKEMGKMADESIILNKADIATQKKDRERAKMIREAGKRMQAMSVKGLKMLRR